MENTLNTKHIMISFRESGMISELQVASTPHALPPPVHLNSQIRLKSLNTICSSVKHFPRLKQNWWLALVLGEADVRSASACAVKAKRSRKRSVAEKGG